MVWYGTSPMTFNHQAFQHVLFCFIPAFDIKAWCKKACLQEGQLGYRLLTKNPLGFFDHVIFFVEPHSHLDLTTAPASYISTDFCTNIRRRRKDRIIIPKSLVDSQKEKLSSAPLVNNVQSQIEPFAEQRRNQMEENHEE